MYSEVRETALKKLTPIIEALGYEVVDIEYKHIRENNLNIYIHKKGGITLDDCERVSNALDAPLEEFDITNGASYVLNISSPGLDRPIVSDKDYERNLNTEVEAFFVKSYNKKNSLNGTLQSYTADIVVLVANGKTHTLDRSNIRLLIPLIKFK
ncbi:MAG: ribosome maturation factor RimP [Clostridia bacterium]